MLPSYMAVKAFKNQVWPYDVQIFTIVDKGNLYFEGSSLDVINTEGENKLMPLENATSGARINDEIEHDKLQFHTMAPTCDASARHHHAPYLWEFLQ